MNEGSTASGADHRDGTSDLAGSARENPTRLAPEERALVTTVALREQSEGLTPRENLERSRERPPITAHRAVHRERPRSSERSNRAADTRTPRVFTIYRTGRTVDVIEIVVRILPVDVVGDT